MPFSAEGDTAPFSPLLETDELLIVGQKIYLAMLELPTTHGELASDGCRDSS